MKLSILQQALSQFKVRRLQPNDYPAVLALEKSNPEYHQYLSDQPITLKEIEADAATIPANIDPSQKFYLGFWLADHLVAVLDLVGGYPRSDFLYLGLLMVDAQYQRKHVGGAIVTGLKQAAKQSGYQYIQLGRVTANPAPVAFWEQMGFEESHQVRMALPNQKQVAVTVMQLDLES